MRELIRDCSLYDQILLGTTERKFIDDVCVIRNSLTHVLDSINSLDNLDMMILIERLDILSKYYLLIDLLFTKEECQMILSNSSKLIEKYYAKEK